MIPAETKPSADARSERALLELIVGYWNTQALRVAARLGIADALAGGPLDVAQLAAATGAHPGSLRRLLNFLRGIDIVEGADGAGYALTELGRLLRSDVEGSMRDLAILYGEEFYDVWGSLLHQVRTGEYAFESVFGTDMFGYFAAHPETGRTFDRAMIAGRAFLARVPEVHDFSAARLVVDVAGGSGALLAAVLKKNPAARGVLFDRAAVVETARRLLEAGGVADRCSFESGDFFAAVPAGGDVYVLCRILHDWEDEQCLALLANCHAAMAPGGELVIVERVLPEDGESAAGRDLALAYDMHMMTVAGGGERSASAYRALLSAAGFDLRASHALPLDVRALVATRR
jgi:ubiquinone/menaquinone biosynthesis C-methylase UbiE